MIAATASSPRPQRAPVSSLLLVGVASHTARASASARMPKTMNRDGSALRAIGRLHSVAQGSVRV